MAEASPYPEHDRLAAIKDVSNEIGAFLDFGLAAQQLSWRNAKATGACGRAERRSPTFSPPTSTLIATSSTRSAKCLRRCAMPEYEVEITIHETGVVTVEAESARAAMDGIRAGTLSWDQFDQTYEAGNPRSACDQHVS